MFKKQIVCSFCLYLQKCNFTIISIKRLYCQLCRLWYICLLIILSTKIIEFVLNQSVQCINENQQKLASISETVFNGIQNLYMYICTFKFNQNNFNLRRCFRSIKRNKSSELYVFTQSPIHKREYSPHQPTNQNSHMIQFQKTSHRHCIRFQCIYMVRLASYKV